MANPYYDPDIPLAPYFNKTEENWSPIWQSPLTEPKISSITVRIDQFEDWENQWLEFHRGCGEPGSHNEGNDQIRFGMLPDYNPDSDEEGPEHLLKCCDAERPRKKKVSLLVKATGKFVTIHDYVSVVHPWLMSLREDILRAEGDLLDNVPLPEDTRLLVDYPGSESVSFSEEKEWQKYKSKKQYDYYATLRKTG